MGVGNTAAPGEAHALLFIQYGMDLASLRRRSRVVDWFVALGRKGFGFGGFFCEDVVGGIDTSCHGLEIAHNFLWQFSGQIAVRMVGF